MKSRYRIWHLPVLSFYSQRLYRDIATRWKGTNLGFLFLLLTLCLIPTAHHIGRAVTVQIDALSDVYLMQIPDMRIVKGRLSVDAPQPYSIIEENRTVLLIDTTGKINTIDEADAEALLTTTHLHIKQNGSQTTSIELSSIEELEINQQIVAEWLLTLKKLIAPFYYAMGLFVSYILLVLSALLCGAIALLFGSIQQRKLNYAAGIRLAVTAFTPPLIISTALKSFGLSIPAVLYILLTLTYLYMAVGAAKKTQSSELYLDEEPVNH
jgi:maltodextrin utilization protein YvdJ